MDRRKFLENAALGGLGLSGLALSDFDGAASPASGAGRTFELDSSGDADRPNLLFVMGDQLRTMSCGYAGDRYGGTYAGEPAPYTPNIDELAGESTDFRNAVSGYPVCAPHRASLMTGKYPSSTGMVINELRAMPDPDAIAHVLEAHGYRTGFIGKWHLYGKHHGDRQQFVPPGPYRLGFDDYWAAFNFNHRYYKGSYYRDKFEKIEIEGFQPNTLTDLGIDFMRRADDDDQPFALFLLLGPPHDPFTWENTPATFEHLFKGKKFPDPPNFETEGAHAQYWAPGRDHEWWMENWYPKRFTYRAAYAALTSALDWQIGRLTNALEDHGLADDTIMALNSDHGEMFGSQGRIAKKIFYEEAARVPMLMRWPGQIEEQITDTPFDVVDIAPTLLGLMDLPVPASMEGRDLSHVALGESGGPTREATLMQGMGHTYKWHNGDEWRAARDERYTYARHLDGPEFLFDNVNDPYQQNNLIRDADHRGARRRLKDYMRAEMEKLNDPFKPTTWYRDHWVEDRVIVRSATRELEEKWRPENIELNY
jgi:arylsulfatase A-like enzyme